MARELEAKFKVENFRALRKALRAAGGVYCGTALQLDTFFDTPNRDLHSSDRGLRLRRIRILRAAGGGGQSGWLLTYKGPREPNRRAKVRQEIQTAIADGEAMARILCAAGLQPVLEIEKRRASYKLGRCLVELDELPMLGCFAEIEAPSERALETARRKLGLDSEPITDSYAHLALARCKKAGRSYNEITFARCGSLGR